MPLQPSDLDLKHKPATLHKIDLRQWPGHAGLTQIKSFVRERHYAVADLFGVSFMEGTAATIEIQVEELSQLFDSLDPFPFRERDLDKSAEEYIVGWAREIGKNQAIEIIIHVPKRTKNVANTNDIQSAIQKYFAYKSDLINRDLSELFRIGRQSLFVGIAVLGTCIVLREFSLATFGAEGLGRALNEGLLILGWVANWRPLEIFLYDWWPLTRRRDLYRRLANAKVLILAREAEA